MRNNRLQSNRSRARRGVTLVEMLVVVSILLLLYAVAAPQLRPPTEKTALREGARLAKGAIARARYRAIATGNPVGLMIRPSDFDDGACVSLAYAQIPTLFSGKLTSSMVTIDSDSKVTFFDKDANPTGDEDHIEVGDMIKFNYQGKKYRVASKGANGDVWVFKDAGSNADPIVTGAKFQVFKTPYPSTQTMPVQLPENVCIDIDASGIGNFSFSPGQTIIILFNTSGLIEQVYVEGEAINPTSPIYLLVGSVGDDDNPSLGTADLGEFWIACGHQTGMIFTADVAEVDTGDATPAIKQSRKYAEKLLVTGGR